MRIKKTIKNMGKSFIDLKQEDERIVRQSVLIVDNGYSWLGYLNLSIVEIKNYFPKLELSVLAPLERKNIIERDFPALNYIFPSQKLRPKKYQIALQMLMLRKEKYDFIVLFSLDITPLIVALFFPKTKVILYNQWRQWWALKLRSPREFFKVTYIKKKTRFNFKDLLKRIGLIFILLQRKDEEIFKRSILIVDNGYPSSEHLDCSIQQIKSSLPKARISVLVLDERDGIKDKFPHLEVIQTKKTIIKTYGIARHMLRLRGNRYDNIILLSLDISPIIVSILFMKGKILLYNRWHQWWSLRPKPIRRYLAIIPQFIFNILIFVYLLISVSWIFLKRSFNIFRFCLMRKRELI